MRQSSRILDRLARTLTRPATRLLVVGVVAVTTLFVVRTDAPLIAVIVLWIATAGMLGVLLTLAGYDADANDLAARLVDGDVEQRLVTRWLERARWARFVGGFAGVIVWAVGFQTEADVLVCGSVGICIGAVWAESHHLRRPAGPRSATLEVRSIGMYLDRSEARRMGAVGAAAIVTGFMGLAVGEASSTASWVGASLATLAVVHLTQRRVASRGRPAVALELRRADDLARRLAIGNGLARPATYAALAMVARALLELSDEIPIAGFLGIAAWFFGAGMWWRNRRLGLGSTPASPPRVAVA